MKRRDFIKWLGIGTATAVAAPQVLAEEVKKKETPFAPGEAMFFLDGDKWKTPNTVINPGRYMMVHLAPTSLPVTAGDIVYYKDDKKGGMLAYVAKKHRWNVPHGFGISNITPGNYGFIQVGTIITVGDWYVHAPARTLFKVEGFKE